MGFGAGGVSGTYDGVGGGEAAASADGGDSWRIIAMASSQMATVRAMAAPTIAYFFPLKRPPMAGAARERRAPTTKFGVYPLTARMPRVLVMTVPQSGDSEACMAVSLAGSNRGFTGERSESGATRVRRLPPLWCRALREAPT